MLETHASLCRIFSSERPEVHEQDADSFMAFIKRWLFVGAFCGGCFCPVWKIHVPAGLALHPGSGVWNFSDWFWEMNGWEFAGTMPSHKCDLATKCYWMTDNKLSRGRWMLIYWFSRDVFSFSHHFFYIIAKTSKDSNFCSGSGSWVGWSDVPLRQWFMKDQSFMWLPADPANPEVLGVIHLVSV